MQVYVVADDTDRDGGYVTQRLRELGAELVPLDRDDVPAFSSLDAPALVLLLGSERSAHDDDSAESVRRESALVLDALDAGTPVMGICYGAQLASRALGGTSYRADDAEIGWLRVDTLDPVLCPEGPWGQFHQDVFSPAPTSRVLGSSWVGPQCFVDESRVAPVIAWQFHPEVTPETFERWLVDDAATVRRTGQDARLLRDEARRRAAASRTAARKLVDAALVYLELELPTVS
ncbi:hypothetical protein ASD11_07960 [Aeromicrobium sp. Root495]|uniref:type 1 glutamine amidotransferase n=1 Tax=Aeromicrobium sp. Root495 TaxID=1736550 RepID=UPI0006FCA5C8|nr:gamma-glutamyl-gamma-aminobutyrate hydrolase family protein [Aeromicrobium sp. Root495]KQY59487.1 hypothetical protein ASD11_07960 [Aeromicrobium sp. Root495]